VNALVGMPIECRRSIWQSIHFEKDVYVLAVFMSLF